jgi:hypothetical protein
MRTVGSYAWSVSTPASWNVTEGLPVMNVTPVSFGYARLRGFAAKREEIRGQGSAHGGEELIETWKGQWGHLGASESSGRGRSWADLRRGICAAWWRCWLGNKRGIGEEVGDYLKAWSGHRIRPAFKLIEAEKSVEVRLLAWISDRGGRWVWPVGSTHQRGESVPFRVWGEVGHGLVSYLGRIGSPRSSFRFLFLFLLFFFCFLFPL